MMKAPPAKFDRPYQPPVLAWDKPAGRYVPTGATMQIVTVNLGDERERAAQAGSLDAARVHLGRWIAWATTFEVDSPVFPELRTMATNVLDDLQGESGYVALAFIGPALVGASTYDVLEAEDRDAKLSEELANPVNDVVGTRPVLYAAYSVAHPWSQYPAASRQHGSFGGFGSALRRMREWQGAEFSLPTYTWASNPRSYLQNLEFGFDDIGEPVDGVFPPPPMASQSVPAAAPSLSSGM
jgi:hypothetical protein